MFPQFAFTDRKLSPVSFDFEGCVPVKMMLTFHYGVRQKLVYRNLNMTKDKTCMNRRNGKYM